MTKPTLPSHKEIRSQIKPLTLVESYGTVLTPILTIALYFVAATFEVYSIALLCTIYLSFVT